ncbi:MAG: prepilin-type N-terminal cleavage/methylation domain-containing protein [Alphaproteobacteria bacterium]|nr:prepilin-type N-terminal cleavage/methylation domain-containing protein [Alphaproteobacteria bacterium]
MAIDIDRRHRRGFSLLEVMIALAILTVSLVILVETQSSAVVLTNEAERTITASDLARYKMSEVLLMIEEDGFQQSDQNEFGDFSDFGEDAMDLEFGDELEDYHWEWLVSEVDIDTLGDLAAAADDLSDQADANKQGADANGSALDALGMMGIGPDMIAQFLGPYIREVRVRVWWGEDSDAAEEDGTEIVLTTHVINPTGALALEQQLPQ